MVIDEVDYLRRRQDDIIAVDVRRLTDEQLLDRLRDCQKSGFKIVAGKLLDEARDRRLVR